jgi:tetratricopeptide (TPR) repeat protein
MPVAVGLVLLAVAFGGQLRGDFVWDDVPLVANNRALVEPGGLWRLLTQDLWGSAGQASTQLYHPLPMLSFWLQAQLHGISLAWFRLVNVLLHAGCALAVLSLMLRLQLARPAALLASLIFLLHPLVTEPVMWLTGRHDTVAALLALGALLAFPAPGAGRRPVRLLLSSLGCAGAFVSKEPYVVAPLLVMALSLVERTPGERLARLAVSWLGPFLAVVAVVVARRSLGISTGSEQLGAAPLEHLRNYANLVQHYATLSVTLDQGPTIASVRPISAAAAVLWLLGCVLASFGLWRARESVLGRVALFGLGWFLLTLLPHVLSLPILGLWGNRYGYFPLVGYCLLLGAALGLCESQNGQLVRPTARFAAVAAAILALVLTRQGAAHFRDDLTLYSASVAAAPHDGRALYHLAHAVRTREGCAGAIGLLARAVEHDPKYARAQRNLAGCLLDLGDARGALEPAQRAVELEPWVASHHYNLGAALLRSGERQRAMLELNRALTLDPEHLPTRRLLASLGER